MKKNKLNQYKADLTPAQIAKGMNAAIVNAKRLMEDALILFNNERYASALSIAILSIEESGKVSILRSLSLAQTQKEILDVWREYRSHTYKNRMWPFYDLIKKGARRLQDFKPLFQADAEHPSLLDNLKQVGFYTDCLGEKANWSIPLEVIDKDLAKSIIDVAGLLASKKEITEREIVLWIKYLKPIWKQNMEVMEAALADWFKECCKEGIFSDDENSMEKFITDGFTIADEKI